MSRRNKQKMYRKDYNTQLLLDRRQNKLRFQGHVKASDKKADIILQYCGPTCFFRTSDDFLCPVGEKKF